MYVHLLSALTNVSKYDLVFDDVEETEARRNKRKKKKTKHRDSSEESDGTKVSTTEC